MQYATKPPRYDQPGSCIVVPGRVHDENGGVLLDTVLDGRMGDIRLWISYAGLHSIARQVPQLDLVEANDLSRAHDALASTQQQLDQVTAERDELQRKLDRIQGLAKDGFKVTRHQGRMPAKPGANH